MPPGTPLIRAAVVHMRGDIKVGSWRSFTASLVVRPPAGFIWAATAQHAAWASGPHADTALATWHIDDHVETVQLHVAADGALREISMARWGNPGGAAYGRHPFGVLVEDERAFDGIRLPSAVRAFWDWGTDREADGEFFRADITSVITL